VFSFSPFFCNTEGGIQGLTLARQVLYQLSHTPTPFCIGYFLDKVSLYAQAGLNHDSLQPLVKWGLVNFLPRLTLNHNPPNLYLPKS
jgi:hypothetical protein